jgi:hypothetical protein
MKTNIELASFVKKFIGCEYWYGCFGQIATSELYYKKKKQYPNQYKWTYKNSDLGKRVFDCVGLIKAYIWWTNNEIKYKSSEDVSANRMYNKSKNKGNIKNIPEIVGMLVWKNNHIGVYIGNGKVVEAKGHKWGVVETKLSDGGWTNWCECPYINYVSNSIKDKNSNISSNNSKTNIKYFKKYNGNSKSIVDALKSLNISSSYSYRKKIAKANNIKNYIGSSSQNIKLLSLLQKGKLIKP